MPKKKENTSLDYSLAAIQHPRYNWYGSVGIFFPQHSQQIVGYIIARQMVTTTPIYQNGNKYIYFGPKARRRGG